MPPPTRSLIPTVHVATAKGWPAGGHPTCAEGLAVTAFAQGLDHPRWLANGKPSGEAIDVLTGFITDEGDALGRPVGVAIDRRGALLIADDVGNTVWRVTATGNSQSGK